MSYAIHITQKAQADIDRAADHLAYVLRNPTAAQALLDETEKTLLSLADFPERFQLPEDEFLAALGVRFIQVKSYLAFYVVEQSSRTVFVIRFLYGKSDWASILRNELSL